jgi:hypothetical protein
MKQKKLFLFFVLLSSLHSICKAQLNESDTLQKQIRASLTGNYQKGNVEIFTARTKLDVLQKFSKHFSFKSQNNSLYQSFFGTKADNDINSRNYFYYKANKRTYPYTIVYANTNFRRKINGRYFAGIGFTYQLLQHKNNIIKVSTNIIYETTNFKTTVYNFSNYNGSNTISTLRSSLYLTGLHHIKSSSIKFWYTAYYQPSLQKMDNYRTQVDMGIDFFIGKRLSFTTQYNATYEHVVAKNTKVFDTNFSFGLGYSFTKQ